MSSPRPTASGPESGANDRMDRTGSSSEKTANEGVLDDALQLAYPSKDATSSSSASKDSVQDSKSPDAANSRRLENGVSEAPPLEMDADIEDGTAAGYGSVEDIRASSSASNQTPMRAGSHEVAVSSMDISGHGSEGSGGGRVSKGSDGGRVSKDSDGDHLSKGSDGDRDDGSGGTAEVHEDDEDKGNNDSDDKDKENNDSDDEDKENNDSDDEDKENNDSDDEEEPEPSLKYERLKGSISDVLRKDAASAFAVCEKYILLGTHAGMLFVFNLSCELIKAFRSHTASIADISVDDGQDFVAAASIDGLVSISSLSSAEHYIFDFKRPMRAVVLEPGFSRRTTRTLVCGGMAGALVHREKGWLGHKETVIHSGEGPIWAVSWRKSLIAWANDRGVRIYDLEARVKVTFIGGPSGQDRLDLYRPHLLWLDDETLIVAWANQLKIAKVRRESSRSDDQSSARSASNSTSRTPQRFVEITKVFELDCNISGVAPHDEDLLVLAYVTELDDDGTSDSSTHHSDEDPGPSRYRRPVGQRPELRIIDPKSGREKSSDVLSISGYERFGCNDYHLAASFPTRQNSRTNAVGGKSGGQNRIWYIISPSDVIVASKRDAKDHVQWLLEQRKYGDALSALASQPPEYARANGFDVHEINQEWLTYLLDEIKDYRQAARAAPQIFGSDATKWEQGLFSFLDRGQLGLMIHVVPTESPTLAPIAYDMALSYMLGADRAKLRELVSTWPPAIYSSQALSVAIEDALRHVEEGRHPEKEAHEGGQDSAVLMETLAALYTRNGQPGKALRYYLRLHRPDTFDLIRDHSLILDVRDQAKQLIDFEEQVWGQEAEGRQAIELLVQNAHSIPPSRVVPQLEATPLYLHRYLSALFQSEPQLVIPYSNLQVALFARFAPECLLQYLRSMSSHYSFEEAYSVCQRYDLVHGMVFLLGRVGDNKRALNLIIERLGDIEGAINFAKEQGDDDLWEDVLRYSETRPPFIRALLTNVGGVDQIDPVRLIRRIKDGLEIPGLKGAVRKILTDYGLQLSLLEGCLDIMSEEGRQLAAVRSKGQMYGMKVAASVRGGPLSRRDASHFDAESQLHSTMCRRCHLAVDAAPLGANSRNEVAVIFLCRHAFHLTCLLPEDKVPSKRREHTIPSEALALGRATTTRTQHVRQQGQRPLNVGEVESWGPALRQTSQQLEWQTKRSFASRLKIPIRSQGGCPVCSCIHQHEKGDGRNTVFDEHSPIPTSQ